jgi:hypothetical protein
VPTSNDIRYHLEKYSDLKSLELDLNTALQSRLPDGIREGQQPNTLVAIITYLLALIEPLKLKIERLYLDREFFCVPVIRWLQALDIPFEMPGIIRGKNGGTRQLIRGRRSYKTSYTLNSDKYGSVTFNVWIVCTYKNGKRRAHLIINIWIDLVWHYLSRLKRSRRQVFPHLFTLKQMLEFLRQTVDRNYGVACEICLPSG